MRVVQEVVETGIKWRRPVCMYLCMYLSMYVCIQETCVYVCTYMLRPN
jgi:hypothetical protein